MGRLLDAEKDREPVLAGFVSAVSESYEKLLRKMPAEARDFRRLATTATLLA